MDAGPRVVVDFIVNGVLNGFVVDHIHMLIPGPEMEGEGLIYYASPNEKYVLRATWTHGVLDGPAELVYDEAFLIAKIPYRKGRIIGVCSLYDTKMHLLFRGSVLDGIRNGICMERNPDGSLKKRERYCKGTPIATITPLPFLPGVYREVSTEGELLFVSCLNPSGTDYWKLFVNYKNNRPTVLGVIEDADHELILKVFKGKKMIEYDENNHVVYKGEYALIVRYLYPRHGTGKEYDSEGHLIYRGEFRNDYYHGEGTLFKDEKKYYKGHWRYGLFDGQGKIFDTKTDTFISGEFRRGCLVVRGSITPEQMARASAVYTSQSMLPVSSDPLLSIRVPTDRDGLREVVITPDPEGWWLDDNYGVTPDIAEKEAMSSVVVSPPEWKNGELRVTIQPSSEDHHYTLKFFILLISTTLSFIVFYLLYLFLSYYTFVFSCSGLFWIPHTARHITVLPRACSRRHDFVVSDFPYLASIVFKRRSFRKGGSVVIANNPQLKTVLFQDECFVGESSLNITTNSNLTTLEFGDHAFENAVFFELRENLELRGIPFGKYAFRSLPSCSLSNLAYVEWLSFDEGSFYNTVTAVFDCAFGGVW